MNPYKSNNLTTLLPKLVGETRHYPPAIKEWRDSVYTYNKNYLKSIPSKDIMASKIIESYFNLSDCKHLARSKRMRSHIRKLSAGKLLISKPELKQTNDNIAITIYTLDSERLILLRKIYHNIRKWENKVNVRGISNINMFNSYEFWRSKYSLNSLNKLEYNALDKTRGLAINKSIKQSFHKNNISGAISRYSLKTKYLLSANRMHYLKTRSNLYTLKKIRKCNSFNSSSLSKINTSKKYIPYYGATCLNEVRFLRYISEFKNNSIQARKRAYYSYMKHILSLLGIKTLSFDSVDSNITRSALVSYNEENNNIIHCINDLNNLRYKGKILLFFKGEPTSKPEVLSINNIQGNLPYLDKVNIVLSAFVNKILNNNKLVKNKVFSSARFSKINFEEFLLKEYMESFSSKNNLAESVKTKFDFSIAKKEISLLKEYINIKINNYKFGKYLPALKLLLGKIYNKNVQLNIVKLKYLHLNSDIFTEVITTKLRKKFGLNIISKCLKLVKIPEGFNEKTNNINTMQKLNVYKSLKLSNLFASTVIQDNTVDNLDLVIKNIYPSSVTHQQKKISSNFDTVVDTQESEFTVENIKHNSNKLMNVINAVKYKWVTGVRLEAAGRLTRRYTASRSLYKYINKGNLKNTDFSRKLEFLKKSMPVIMFRNTAKTNTQYTFANSKKRIGAFGIKGWISSY